jgi:hypothetical protein
MAAARPYDRADDKERAVGLLAAPVSGAITVLVTSALISNDPPAPRPHHVPVAVYHELEIALLVLSLAMVVLALWRHRLLLGVVMALFGLALFNMHYWGFGIPYLIAGSWYLVRSYRMQREWREENGEAGPRGGRPATGPSGPRSAKPGASGRYTPPTAGRRRRRR